MRSAIILSALTLASAFVLPRAPVEARADYCCFELYDSSVGRTVQEPSSGQTYLSTSAKKLSYPYQRYCVNLKDGKNILYDGSNGACILDSSLRMTCLDPIPGDVPWTLKDGYLAYGGSTAFKACKASDGSEEVWGGGKTGSGCRSMKLKANKKTGSC